MIPPVGASRGLTRGHAFLLWLCVCTAAVSFLSTEVLAQRQERQQQPIDPGANQSQGQNRVGGTKRPTATATATGASTSTSGIVDATLSPVALVESQIVSATLDVISQNPAQFYLNAPFQNTSNPLIVTATLCSGPSIPAYDVSDPNVLKQLGLDYYKAQISTLARMYVSTDQANKTPGPYNLTGQPDVEYFFGGLAVDYNTAKQPDGAWISIYPPQDTRNVTGTWTFAVAASTNGAPLSLQSAQGLSFADSDRTNALLTTYNASQGISSNLTLVILPTEGQGSLPEPAYFNSSYCAITTAFNAFNSGNNPNRPAFNRTQTIRGSIYDNTTRVQWAVSNLNPGTNYTAWLFDFEQANAASSNLAVTTMWPAIKFVTKTSQTCRLVYDVDFCPGVAYSIPISPDVSTQRALSVINNTVTPNFGNFSATLSTFPCNSTKFGQYSPVHTCTDCLRAYQNWLCAVTMPRCVDPLPTISNMTSAAVPNPLDLLGIENPLNTQLLPYIIDRNNNSRQSYIDAENGLDANRYGELLPCIYTCYFVERSCPQPLIQWYCPLWDITAQSQYGTFADAGEGGLGGGYNGGAGSDGQRWGGPSRYIAQDSFGNLYCNSMNVDRVLIATNAAQGAIQPSHKITLLISSISAAVLITLFTA